MILRLARPDAADITTFKLIHSLSHIEVATHIMLLIHTN
jgi:hypothetical protein